MEKYKLSKEWIEKNAGKVKYGFATAVKHNYDIKSAQDVLKILKEIDPGNATEENAKIFSSILKIVSKSLQRKFETKLKIKPKTVN